MNYEEKINNAILTLDVLIDCTKEDGTSYNAQKEWEALETFKQLQTNWNELKEWLKMEHREDAIVINLTWKHATGKILNKINELEGKSE